MVDDGFRWEDDDGGGEGGWLLIGSTTIYLDFERDRSRFRTLGSTM